MPTPFVSEDMFPIVIRYFEKTIKSSGLPAIRIIGDTDKDKELEVRYKDNIKSINTQWVQPNWKESNEVTRESTKFDPIAGQRVLDWPMYRMRVLERFMRSWDVSSDGKQSIPCTPENIAKLNPQIAGALVDAFMDKTSLRDEDLGN